MRPSVRAALLSALLVGVLCLTGPVHGQGTGSLVGRIVDAETGDGVSDAMVVLVDTEQGTLSDDEGMFGLEGVPIGDYLLRVVHVAYGDFSESLRIEEDVELALRISLSQTAIELEPVVVEALSAEEFEVRSRGTRRNVITREDIVRSQASGGHLGHILVRRVPGIRLRNDLLRVGQPVCIEFRSPVSLHETRPCRHPVVILDGVRVSAPQFLYTTLPIEDIERMEVIPPAEAGVAYGSDSRYGVILIETRAAADVLGGALGEPALMTALRYDWALEPHPYDWKRVLAFSFLGGLAGTALGHLAAQPCLSLDDLSSHFHDSDCGKLGTTGSRFALLTFSQLGASLASRYGGGTEVSRGKFFHALLATSLVAIPGVVLSLTTSEDGFSGSDALGKVLLGIGVPVSATLSDWMFRSSRSP